MYINLMDISYNYRIPVTEMSAWQPNSHQWSVMKPSVDGFWLMVGVDILKNHFHVPMKMRLTAANGAVVHDEITSMSKY
jgi:hypothetical protein